MKTLLDSLKTMTVVVADTGDFASIEKWRPRDVTTNPSLITSAVQQGQVDAMLVQCLRDAKQELPAGAALSTLLSYALDRVFVAFGTRITPLIAGRISTEVDARLSYDTQATVDKARRLIALYRQAGISSNRILIKIASTYEGILAAQQLEQEGIHCNMTLLFSLNQAVACSEAGVTLISPFVGRILDWYKKYTGRDAYPATEDPGVLSVSAIYRYLKQNNSPMEIMGASFRNVGEITELAGCDLLTIAPKFLEELQATPGSLVRKLDPAQAMASARVPLLPHPLDQAAFSDRHNADPMASEKLGEGIATFSKDIQTLESLLVQKMPLL